MDGWMDGCLSPLCRQGVDLRDILRKPTPPKPHAPRMNQGQLPPGAPPPPPPPPSLVPKYFPPSQSSWDRKIPRAAGPALPACH